MIWKQEDLSAHGDEEGLLWSLLFLCFISLRTWNTNALLDTKRAQNLKEVTSLSQPHDSSSVIIFFRVDAGQFGHEWCHATLTHEALFNYWVQRSTRIRSKHVWVFERYESISISSLKPVLQQCFSKVRLENYQALSPWLYSTILRHSHVESDTASILLLFSTFHKDVCLLQGGRHDLVTVPALQVILVRGLETSRVEIECTHVSNVLCFYGEEDCHSALVFPIFAFRKYYLPLEIRSHQERESDICCLQCHANEQLTRPTENPLLLIQLL